MTRHKGAVLALFGFVILVGSLVMSSPFASRGEGKGPAPAIAAPAAPLMEAPEDFVAGPAVEPQFRGAPYQESGPVVFLRDELEAQLTFPVPLGRHVMIESVSVRVNVGVGQRAAALFMTTCGGNSTHFAVPLTPQGAFGKQEVFAGLHPVRAHAGGGTTIWIRVERTAPGESDSGFVTLSGRLE